MKSQTISAQHAAPRTNAKDTDTSVRNPLQRTGVVVSLAAIACLLWGSAPASIKNGYELLGISGADSASQILFAGVRFVIAGLIALALGSAIARKPLVPSRSTLPLAFRLCLFQTVGQYVCYYIGLAHTTGVKASIIVSLNTFIAMAIACLVFRQERLTSRKALGCVLGIAGVVIANVSSSGFDASLSWQGEGLVLASGVAYAFSSVLVSRYSHREDPALLSGMQFLMGGSVMVALGLALGGTLDLSRVDARVCALTVYLGFISGVAYTLWALLLKNNPVSRISVLGSMNPVFGVILSAIFLGEAGSLPLWQCICALGLVCAGIVVVNRPSRA